MERLLCRDKNGLPECIHYAHCSHETPCNECYIWGDIAEKLAEYYDLEEAQRLIKLPCNPEYPVYHICKCKDIPTQLDGTLYGVDGGHGTATGYYCPYEDSCPHDTDNCDLCKDTFAVFEDVVTGFYIGEDYNGVQLKNTPSVYFSDFGKTIFVEYNQAEAALSELNKNGE